ncbi:tRNA lysidine(34) synthetase TilS [Neptunicella sp. SCSIO 80796]|uniref:tRNA lysidine(34) synthetase TilS n=1 Tax=Neptunicella plasticusilytica TaxID=3117012 RepID=UPI003A4D5664
MEIIKAVSSVLNCPSRPMYVAYSGGVDSHVLLHCVSELMDNYPQHQYTAIHINHGLSSNADQWQQHCQQICRQLDIAFISHQVVLDNIPRTSLEAQAREARYAAIDNATPDNAVILLAQHVDDQLETFLLQLKRGAGPKGLSSMAALQQGNGARQYRRPFLAISRQQILDYASQHELDWQEDESNQDSRFDRNFLRQRIVPLLLQRWPAMATSVSRSAALCAEQQSMLDEISQQHLNGMLGEDGCLAIDALLALSSRWQKQVIRLWLSQQQIPLPNAKVMALIEPELLRSSGDAEACIQWQDWQLRKFNQQLYVLSEPLLPALENKVWRGEKELTLAEQQIRVQFDYQDNQGIQLGYDNQKAIIRLGFGSFAETFKPAGERHSKPLKKWFQLWQVPPWKRASIPLVYVNGELAMVVGISVAEQFSSGKQTIWIRQVED